MPRPGGRKALPYVDAEMTRPMRDARSVLNVLQVTCMRPWLLGRS